MSYKIAAFGYPHMRLPRVHMARIVIKTDHEEEEYDHPHKWHHRKEKEHDSHAYGSHELSPAMADVHERMESPPHTWKEYHGKPGGMMSIVEMEYRELMTRKGEGSVTGMKKELIDLAAACICAAEKMHDM